MFYLNNNYHFFQYKEKYFLYGINTRLLAEISELTYLMLCQMPADYYNLKKNNYGKFSVKEINETFKELKKNKIISRNNIPPRVPPPTPNFFKKEEILGKHGFNGLYLVICQDCNLRCRYCSAEYGRFGKNPQNKFMTVEVSRKALEYFFDNLQDNLEKVTIIFMGGEPLMNFEVLKQSVEYSMKKSPIPVDFILNTNGILMDEYKAKWFAENKNISVRFSIDGTNEMHNASRIYPNGKGSYDDTKKGLQIFLKFNQESPMIQASISKGKQYKNAVRHLWNLGAKRVIANITGESAFLDSSDYVMSKDDFESFMKELDEINQEIANNLINKGYSCWISLTEGQIKSILSKSIAPYHCVCGAGRTISITPDGSVYICQGFVGFEQYKIGTIYTEIDYDKLEEFGNLWAKVIDKCSDCWVRNSCSVSCIARYLTLDGLNSKEPSRYCNLAKKLFEASAYMLSKLMDERPEIFNILSKGKRL
ncbi:radical SAM protein [Melioribacteraceae bacterium 4301-Me]|uniref:radical SAM protein n=1 Tax=Pyranulibacter aquaticus TaxID=3163344 RepID=UPI003595DB5C